MAITFQLRGIVLLRTALAVSAASLIGVSLPAQDADSAMIRLRVPDSIGVFAMSERKDFDDPSLGVLLRYMRADSLTVDVFVYPGADLATNCPTECAAKVLDGEVAGFIASFPEMERRGYADSISVVSDQVMTPAADDRWKMGRHLRLRMIRRGMHEQSDFYLSYMPGFRLKLRASYVPDSANATVIAEFSRRIVPALTDPVLAQSPTPDERHIGVSVMLPGSVATAFTQLITALRKQGYTIADSSRATGRIVTARHLPWPRGSEKEKWHGTDSPGVMLIATMSTKGDSTAVEITGRSPTVAGWKDADVANTLELMSVVMLAGALPKSKSH